MKIGLRCVRLFHSSSVLAVDKSALGKLRKKTGYPFINCKKALEQFDNDITKAEAWLREQAQKEGWAKAQKLQDRPMSQGRIGFVSEGNAAAMVEVNCETDFVAKNQKFQSLVAKLASACLKHGNHSQEGKMLLDKDQLGELSLGERTAADMVALEIGGLGENMAIRRAAYLKAAQDQFIGHYIHGGGGAAFEKCQMGKFGAMVLLEQSQAGGLSMEALGRQLSQHVVGMRPSEVGSLDLESSSSSSESDSDSETSDSDSSSSSDDERPEKKEEGRMLYQEFVLDPEVKVHAFLKENNASVFDFVRYECGEEEPQASPLEHKDSGVAA